MSTISTVALIGRHDERELLDQLVATARQGLSATLVVIGEPGVGKTALIDATVSAASDFLVLRVTGVESEKELAFGTLHRLLTPYLDQVVRLPSHQRDAIN